MKMPKDMPLFAYRSRAPYQKGSRTSREAADDMTPKRVTVARRVLSLIASRSSGATADEVSLELKKPPQTVTARIRELVIDGYLEKTEQVRLTQWGKNAHVYIATEKGRAVS